MAFDLAVFPHSLIVLVKGNDVLDTNELPTFWQQFGEDHSLFPCAQVNFIYVAPNHNKSYLMTLYI